MARSGKTVEIINTDAEGRLVLGDALDYALGFKPDLVVNAATLTGAVGIALGRHCTAIMGNSNRAIERVQKAGDVCGEKLWELPLWEEYMDEVKSDVADIKNASNARLAGTILGGMFLKQFVDPKVPWAHLDIAYTGWDLGHLPYHPKRGASGAQVRTLAKLAWDFS